MDEDEVAVEELAYEDDDEEEGEVEEPSLEYVEGRKYTNWELTQMADALLRADGKKELCRKCGEYGDETGHVESMAQYDSEEVPILDGEGNQLYMDFPEIRCKNGHLWYKGEGKARGNGGKNPILFEEHLKNRRRREIYNSMGVPDPSIQSGMYNRVHPQGRKVNSDEQRAKHGASFYR